MITHAEKLNVERVNYEVGLLNVVLKATMSKCRFILIWINDEIIFTDATMLEPYTLGSVEAYLI